MIGDITGLCQDHSFESAIDICRRCGAEYCDICLVYPFGASKPLGKECAMLAGGVRSHVARAALGKRDIRRLVKAFEAHRQDRMRAHATADGVDATTPKLHDPLAPTDEDLERILDPVTVPNDQAAAESLDARFNNPPPPAEQPAAGVAPPIDWSQPFG